ncbi:sodium-dependent nutrient amino acid transporter 1-like isoform X2 [Onthophagus taurus]
MNKEIYTISNNNEVNDEKSLKKSALTKEVWSHELQFLMSCIAMSVGLGNIWRFPFTAYQNGGGAFLIPYLIVLILVGRPIYYLEMCLGQFTAKGNVKLFEAMAPALRGIGYSQITGTICIATYYCSLLSLSLFYFINSFTGDLPWSYCRDEWEAENFLKNVTCIPSNSNGNSTLNGITSSELYFRREVLKEKINIDDGIGLPEWRLVLCLVFVWCCIFIISRNGIQSTGKASYFLALFPYVVILALLIRSVTLEGATDGLVYLFKPNWDKLIEPEVWYAAATQCFFSLNVGVGTITAYASYNGFRHNIYRDVNIITTLDTFTSLIAGSTIFGILGNLANKLNVDVSEVINTGGTGLAFISYPEAIARFDAVPWMSELRVIENNDCNGNITIDGDEKKKDDVEAPSRDTWGKGVEFLMSCIAMSVGLGNIWRFPFTAYQNGGGAFLIPYLIVLLLVGRPMYYLEMCLGQFTSFGNVRTFYKMAPILKGIGYGQMLGSMAVATYYCSLVALTLFYLINSFTSDLPWSKCREEWQEHLSNQGINCIPSNGNVTANESAKSSSELYFRIEVLKEKDEIYTGLGVPEWRLTLCLIFSYFVLFVIIRNGIKSSGKAAYFLAIFPYVVMFALLGRAVTLQGAGTGMLYFIEPKWEKLLEAQVWYAAVTQCFFSLNVGFGTITMFSSYNNFKQNIYRDCLIVSLLDTCTSLLSGTTIFGILGHLAFKLNVDVSKVINAGGTGLAFISYPEAIAKFDAVPWLFAILFFFMLFVLGIGSMVALQGVAVTVIMDSFPHLKTWMVSLGTITVGFLFSLVYVTNGGQFIFTLVDFFGGTMIFLILTIFETTSVFW